MSENELASLPFLTVDRPRAGVVTLTLADHPRRNVMSDEMTDSWVRAIDALTRERDVRAVVVTGEGSAFCSGGDLGWLAAEPDASVDQLRARMLPFYRAWLSIRRLEVPTIAAINGPAIGAGLCVAMACDLRYAAASATMGAPFVKLGLHPGMASTYLFPDVVGSAAARDLLITGRLVRGEEAVRLGLVSRIIEGESFLEEVLEVAGAIAENAPVATRLTKLALALAGAGHRDLESALQWEALAQPVTMATADLQEGIAAAREKRPARFTGR